MLLLSLESKDVMVESKLQVTTSTPKWLNYQYRKDVNDLTYALTSVNN